eukprot:11613183-Alexandrium_andersonii.AAC.1
MLVTLSWDGSRPLMPTGAQRRGTNAHNRCRLRSECLKCTMHALSALDRVKYLEAASDTFCQWLRAPVTA